MSVTKPIVLDETFSDKMDALIAKFGKRTLTITATSNDGTAVTNQTIKVYNNLNGQLIATLLYNAPTSLTIDLPDGFNYLVVPVVTLANHYCEDKPSGMISANTTVTLTYKSLGTISTFTGLKAAVDAGLGQYIELGTEVSYTDSELGTLTWECVDWREDTGEMTLLMKDTLATDRQFDAPEALYYCASALSAGDYKWKDGSTYRYFTLVNEAPQGAQIRATSGEFRVYATKGGTVESESGSVSTTEIAGATDLGTSGTGALNHADRVSYGSNDYGESAIRQYLNASGLNWWVPKTGFDRPPAYAATAKGFLTGMPAEVADCIATTAVRCASQDIYCAPDSSHGKNQQYVCNDKIFLASEMEMYGSSYFADGSLPYGLYIGATNADRIKRYNGTARQWWLRSTNSGVHQEYFVNQSGATACYITSNSYGVVPACKIKKS